MLPEIILVCGGSALALTGLGAPSIYFHPDCIPCVIKPLASLGNNSVSRAPVISEITCHGVTNIEYAEGVTAERTPDLIT